MKTKILLSITLFFFVITAAHAQINEGRYLLGGSVSFNSSKNPQISGSKSQSLYTNIQLGKVIKDNTVAGVLLSYGYSNNGSSLKSNQYGAGVFYRKYKSIAKDFYLFGEADALYNYSKNTQGNFQAGNNGTRYINNGGTLSFTPGISYSVCKRMQMELLMQNLVSLSYGVSKTETTSTGSSAISTSKSNSFSANANLNSNLLSNFGIGFKFFLGK